MESETITNSILWLASEQDKLVLALQKGELTPADYLIRNYVLVEQAQKMHKQELEDTWITAHQAGRFEGKGIAQENWSTFDSFYKERFED